MIYKSYIFSLFIALLMLSSCNQEKELTEDEVYEFLELCFEDYYLNYDVEITEELNKFEKQLTRELRLKDTTGRSYKRLLKDLEENSYFEAPFNTANFNEVILFKNPTQLLECMENSYGIDSIQVSNTRFYKVQGKILEVMTENDEVSIQYFFNTYRNRLSPEEIKKPYVKQTILSLLYRWYYQSSLSVEDEGQLYEAEIFIN